jgi:hypothetical protein
MSQHPRRRAMTYHGALQRLLDKLAVDVFSTSDLKDRCLFPSIVNEVDDANLCARLTGFPQGSGRWQLDLPGGGGVPPPGGPASGSVHWRP